jgi:TonB-dependent starch-binding outer membrane protein SusC
MRYFTALHGCVVGAILTFTLCGTVWAQTATGTVRGQVSDAVTARPLSGVHVAVVGMNRATVSDERGMFMFLNVPAGTVTVRADMLGFAATTREVSVVAGQTAVVDFGMRETAVALDELVVTATGQTRRREIGNSMSTINATELAVSPIKGTQDMLSGRATGVFVLANSGQPGAGGTIRLRGNNSVSQGNNPIIYIDGVRMYSGLTPTNVFNRQGGLPLNDINTADIDRIEVIKGPAATTLYGTEASSGVIQIFTKQGSAGSPSWTAELSAGVNNMGRIGAKDDPTGMWIKQCRGDGMVTGAGVRFEDPTCPESGSWLRNGPIQRYSLSVRGGAPEMSYYVSANYSDEQGVLRNMGTAVGGFRVNASFRPIQNVDFTVSSSYTKRNTDWVPDGNSANGFLLNVSRGPSSNFKGEGCSDPSVICVNNAELFTTSNTTSADHYITGATLKYAPVPWFVNRLSIGYDYNSLNDENIAPFGFYRVPLGEIYWRDWNRRMITMDYAATLTRQFGSDFASTFSFGAQTFDSRLYTQTVTARDFAGPGTPTLTSAAIRDVTGDSRLKEINAGFFLQEVLAWRDRLFLTAGLRVDGNSAFGEDFGLQPYPKVAASYILSDHDFWPTALVETLKLRAAFGESGKAPGAFDAVRTWNPIAGDDGKPAFTPEQLGNPLLGPERTQELELGFEASALEGRIGIDFTFYNQKTIDALIPVRYPPSEGFLNRQLENIGELQTRGFEVRLDGGFVRTATVDWRGRLNLSTIDSKAIDIGGEVYTVASLARSFVQEGYPVPSYIGKVITNPNEFADPIIETGQFIGPPYPTKIIGLGTDLTLFGRFTADAVGEWQLGGHLLNAMGYMSSNLGVWYPCNSVQEKTRAFAAGDATALNDVTAMERARCAQGAGLRDYDWWVEKNDFFKLRTVTLSYQLPENLLPRARNATLTLAGRNLYTITDYSGGDPDVTDVRDNAFSRRDYYVFPAPRSFLLSMRVNF